MFSSKEAECLVDALFTEMELHTASGTNSRRTQIPSTASRRQLSRSVHSSHGVLYLLRIGLL